MGKLSFSQIPGTGDVKVLNYALALEALETDLYIQAYMRLTDGGTNALGIKLPGLGLDRSQIDVQYVREFANVEIQHRNFLDSALGNASLLKNTPFSTAKFNFGFEKMNRREVITQIYEAERLGVGAYLGAIPYLTTRTYLQTAGAIQGTEARHTAVVAIVLNELFNLSLETAPLSNQNNGIDGTFSPNAVLATVSPCIVLGS
ncbi:MAG: ferritin-like domain-containing protein [Tepidisphaeraceae bacterium]